MSVAQWIGMTIDGRYVVDRVLGEGGMGVVLRAHHQFTGANVAVKLIRPELEMTPEIQHRFLAEARAANAIGHDGIVQVLDAGKAADGSLYLVMELLEGQSLRVGMLTRPFGVDEVRRILRDLLGVLSVAHSRGFVHRDLKPDNVFLEGPAATVKLLDFGIAKVLGANTGHVRTVAGTTLGTPAYMAPEQLRDASSVDARADLWAVGVMVYELISGRLPFEGSMHDMLVAIASRDPDPIRAHIAGVSPSLEVFFTRALARDPRARFGTAAEMASAIAMVALPDRAPPSAQPPVHTPPASWAPHAATPPASWAAPAASTPAPHAAPPSPLPATPSSAGAWAPTPAPPFTSPAPPFASAAPTPAPVATPPPSTTPPRGSSRALMWIALGLGLVMVAGFVTFLVRRADDSARSTTPAPAQAPGEEIGEAVDECARGCDASASCLLAPTNCLERCRTDSVVRACVTVAGDCTAAARCILGQICGASVPSGAGRCQDAIACAENCSDLECVCSCSVGAHPRHILALSRVAMCAVNCSFDDDCVASQCRLHVQTCLMQ